MLVAIRGSGTMRKGWPLTGYQCPNCKGVGTTMLTLEYSYQHVYYIPWMTYGKRYQTRCSTCHHTQTLTPTQATKLVPGARPNLLHRFGCLLMAAPSLCGFTVGLLTIGQQVFQFGFPVYIMMAGCGASVLVAIALFVADIRTSRRKA